MKGNASYVTIEELEIGEHIHSGVLKDEAIEVGVKKQKIVFTAPIAKTVNGEKECDTVSFRLGGRLIELKILKINYQ
ncbi:MAG: GreA/GreB family elongation factor [Weeksellaceae bacterium]